MSSSTLELLIEKHGLSEFRSLLTEQVRECIAFRSLAASDADLPVGATKLGGHPDLPEDIRWPRNGEYPLYFVAQINLATLPSGGGVHLPPSGVLSFFHDGLEWGFKPEDKDSFRVFFFDVPVEKLRRQAPPEFPIKKWFGLVKGTQTNVYGCCAWQGYTLQSLPDECEAVAAADASRDSYYELLEELGGHHRLGGHAEPIQGPMELECQLVTNGLYCGDSRGYRDPRAAELEKDSDKWKLLLQVDSDESAGIMFGDAGRLYFWIKEEDLLRREFDKSWMILQCY